MAKDQELFERVTRSKELVRKYLYLQADNVGLELADRTSRLVDALLGSLLWLLVLLLVFTGLSFAFGWWLHIQLDSGPKAILAVFGIYILAFLILLFFKRSLLTRPIRRLIFKALTNEKEYG